MGKYRLAASNNPRVETFLLLSIRIVLGHSKRLLPILKLRRRREGRSAGRQKSGDLVSGELVMLLTFRVRGVAGTI